MEYCSGGSLFQLLYHRRETLPRARLIRISLQIASAMAALHVMHIIHRDLKVHSHFPRALLCAYLCGLCLPVHFVYLSVPVASQAQSLSLCVCVCVSSRVVSDRLQSCNVLLDEGGVAKLCDFGLVRVKNRVESVTAAHVGTTRWMAPGTTGALCLHWRRLSDAARTHR
jgi:serine/threonine protein kinase